MSGLFNPSPATNLKFDASNNVLANIAAQNINPNANALNAYLPSLLSHQTGLSGTPSTVNSPVNVGSAITVNRQGLLYFGLKGHISAGVGIIDYTLTRNSITYYVWEIQSSNHTSTILGTTNSGAYDSLWSDSAYNNDSLTSTTSVILMPTLMAPAVNSSTTHFHTSPLSVLNGDVIQFRVSNATAGDTTYIDDLVVILQ